jgi:hypothetical protein
MTKKKEKPQEAEPVFAQVASQATIKQIVINDTVGIKFEDLKFSPEQIEILARLRAGGCMVRITIEEVEPGFDSLHPADEPKFREPGQDD